MRNLTIALAIGTALAALLAGTAKGRAALTHQVNVTVTNGGCALQNTSVSPRNTTILFHVINNGTVPHGFTIWGVRSGLIRPHQESRFLVNFRKPGRYPFTCSTQRAVFKRGTFTIRTS
jgi:heme/copper-type cytochrome/quinol oxidase subunit 2